MDDLPLITGNLFSIAIDRRSKKPQHMELIGNHFGIREEVFNEAFVGIREIENHIFHILASFNVFELFNELALHFATGKVSDSFIVVVDQDGCKFAVAVFSREEVFVNANSFWPRVVHMASQSKIEMLVESLIDKPI